MIVWLRIHWFRPSDFYCSLHEICLIVVIDCCISILFFIEFDKSESSDLFSHVVFGNFDRFYLSEGVEESIQIVGSYGGGKVAHVNGPFEIVFILVHHSLIY